MDLKKDIDSDAMKVRGLNTPVTLTGRSMRLKFSKQNTEFMQRVEQVDLLGIYRTFHPTDAEHTFI